MNSVITSHPIRIDMDRIEPTTKARLDQILGRDYRIIRKYLNVIKANKGTIISETKAGKKYVNKSALDQLTATTDLRLFVKHDFKHLFPRISLNEMKECRDEAVACFDSYLAMGKSKHFKNIRYPSMKRTIPRPIGYRRFKLDLQNKTIHVMDSMVTSLAGLKSGNKKIRHNYLKIPLEVTRYDKEHLGTDNLKNKSIKIYRNNGEYIIRVAQQHNKITALTSVVKPIGVVGIDLGISKDAVVVLLTEKGVSYSHYFDMTEIKKAIAKVDKRIASLQNSRDTNGFRGSNSKGSGNQQTDGVNKLLRSLRHRRQLLRRQADHQLTAAISKYIVQFSKKYDIHVAIGRLKGLRRKQRRGNGNKSFRRIVHRFTFARMTEMLKYKLAKQGIQRRFVKVNEAWTSIMCFKCNTKGKRLTQADFMCINPSCQWSGNADFNGAINIAKRLVQYRKLTAKRNFGIRGLGRYLRSNRKNLLKSGSTTIVSNSRNRRGAHAGSQINASKPSSNGTPKRSPKGYDLEHWFESDLPVVKDMEKLTSMTSLVINQKGEISEGEAERSPIS